MVSVEVKSHTNQSGSRRMWSLLRLSQSHTNQSGSRRMWSLWRLSHISQ